MFIKRFFAKTQGQHAAPGATEALSAQAPHFDSGKEKLRLNLVHILPVDAMHGLQGYRETIETIAWGLAQLGADVMTTVNALQANRVNIIFGAQVLREHELTNLPTDTIIYNLEQMGGLDLSGNRVACAIAQRFQIWDYSKSNLHSWERLNPTHPVIYVPIGWAPILKRIPKPAAQDIDVIIYGKPGPLRLSIFSELCQRGLRCLFVCGLYGQARDELIARSKLVLNINLYDHSRIFEIVRVSYLLANAKAVVADFDEKTNIEADLNSAVVFASHGKIVDTCIELLRNDALREEYEIRGRQSIEQRNIVPILITALTQSRLTTCDS